MQHQLQYKNSGARLPGEFITVCIIVFIAAVSATVYFMGSMGYEMIMPGGWKMSMMFMRMPGQTWLLSALSFLLMWLAMMVAMMMPSVLPMFLKTRRPWRSLCYLASGYFTIWLIAGLVIYILAVAFNNAAMRSEFLSRAVFLLSGALLIATGIIQFTPWKMTHLLHCRSTSGCAVSCSQNVRSFRLGCKQGLTCCACCSALMISQLIIGIMNPFAMIIIAIVIAAEKLLPQPKLTTRFAGIIAIVAGIIMIIHWATSPLLAI